MQQSLSLFTRLQFRLAAGLSQTHWVKNGSATKQRFVLKCVKRCADAGYLPARSFYGCFLMRRATCAKDQARGARYVIQAAQEGESQAQYQAGRIYEFGCAQYQVNPKHAVTWYARAGDNGHINAAERLAKAFYEGELGLPSDENRGDEWQSKAIALQQGELSEPLQSSLIAQ